MNKKEREVQLIISRFFFIYFLIPWGILSFSMSMKKRQLREKLKESCFFFLEKKKMMVVMVEHNICVVQFLGYLFIFFNCNFHVSCDCPCLVYRFMKWISISIQFIIYALWSVILDNIYLELDSMQGRSQIRCSLSVVLISNYTMRMNQLIRN